MSNYNTILQSNNTDLQAILNTINALQEADGIELPTLTNPGTAEDLMLNKQLIDGEGNIVEGTFTIDEELATQNDLITQIQSTVNELPEDGITSSGTCSLTLEYATNTTINKIYYSSNDNYIYTSDNILSNVDIGKPIFISYICEASHSIEYSGATGVNILYDNHDTSMIIIQCTTANLNAYLYIYCAERD